MLIQNRAAEGPDMDTTGGVRPLRTLTEVVEAMSEKYPEEAASWFSRGRMASWARQGGASTKANASRVRATASGRSLSPVVGISGMGCIKHTEAWAYHWLQKGTPIPLH